MDINILNLLGAYSAIFILLISSLIFIFRLLDKQTVEFWLGIAFILSSIPLIYLIITAPQLDRPNAGYPIIPGKSWWLKAGILSIVEITTIIFYAILILNVHPFVYWDFILGLSVINLVLGFDLRGIVSGYPSEAEWLLKKLGMKSIGHIFSAEKKNEGLIQQGIDKCNNCRFCLMVCPKGAFAVVGKMDIRVRKRSECFACNACVTQCAENALELED